MSDAETQQDAGVVESAPKTRKARETSDAPEATVVQRDAASGEFVAVPAREAVPARVVSAPRGGGAVLQRVHFLDEPATPDNFQTVVLLDGMTVNIDLLDEVEYTRYQEGQRRIGEQLMAMAEFSGTPEEAVAAGAAIHQAQLAACDDLLGRKVKGFGGYADTAGRRRQLVFTDKIRLCDLMVQKSRLGRAETDFSAGS